MYAIKVISTPGNVHSAFLWNTEVYQPCQSRATPSQGSIALTQASVPFRLKTLFCKTLSYCYYNTKCININWY